MCTRDSGEATGGLRTSISAVTNNNASFHYSAKEMEGGRATTIFKEDVRGKWEMRGRGVKWRREGEGAIST